MGTQIAWLLPKRLGQFVNLGQAHSNLLMSFPAIRFPFVP
jgi:hypothetical protein